MMRRAYKPFWVKIWISRTLVASPASAMDWASSTRESDISSLPKCELASVISPGPRSASSSSSYRLFCFALDLDFFLPLFCIWGSPPAPPPSPSPPSLLSSPSCSPCSGFASAEASPRTSWKRKKLSKHASKVSFSSAVLGSTMDKERLRWALSL